MVKVNADFIAPCALYCGVCAAIYATRGHNPTFKERLFGVYRGKLPGCDDLSTEDIRCEGCLSENPFLYCVECAIKACTRGARGYTGCHECEDFPCGLIEDFPIPVGKKVILQAIPPWREVGTEEFVRDEEARYFCPQYGQKLFRGAKRFTMC